MSACFYAVGVGPGDPELITEKALRVLSEADLLAIPDNAREACLAYQIAVGANPALAQKPFLLCPMVMTKDRTLLEKTYQSHAALLSQQLDQGLCIAMPTLGDPSVYSTAYYVLTRLKEFGYPVEMIPGVPSFCAAAARLQVSLGERDTAIHILPGSYEGLPLAELDGTRVIMKTGRRMKALKEELSRAQLSAVMAENCGLSEEMLYHSLEEIPDQAGYFSLLIAKRR